MPSLPHIILLLAMLSAAPAAAQGLRVSTVVKDAGRLDASYNEAVVSTSFSLFHNGRAYDYVDASGEVVVYEWAAKKFTIINSKRGVFTSVTFDELKHLLDARGPRTEEYISELQAQEATAKERAATERAIRMLRFQLAPRFTRSFDPGTELLTLKSPSWKYTVRTQHWDDQEQLQQYIRFTDWTAKLNYVLHPSSMFPEPRLALNQYLRELGHRIPVIVGLDLRPDERVILRAEHKFVRNLSDRDRQLISGWDQAVKGTELKEIPFLAYQKSVLVSQR